MQIDQSCNNLCSFRLQNTLNRISKPQAQTDPSLINPPTFSPFQSNQLLLFKIELVLPMILAKEYKNLKSDGEGLTRNQYIMREASERIIRSPSFLTIKKEYLVPLHYQSVKDNNQKLNQSYDQLCDIFISNYEAFAKAKVNYVEPGSLTQKKAGEDATKFKSIAFFTKFMIDFEGIMEQVADLQIANLNRLQTESKISPDAYLDVMDQLRDLNSVYEGIQTSKAKLDPLFRQIKLQFTTYKKNLENTLNFYDQNYVNRTNEKLLEDIKRALGLLNSISQKNQYIQKRIPEFEPVLSKWKCKLVKNKYNILKKIKHFIRNNKSCFIQLSFLLKECISNHHSLYIEAVQNQLDSIQLKELMRKGPTQLGHPSDENKRWEVAIKSTLSNHWSEYEAVHNIFFNLKENLKSLYSEYQGKRQRIKDTINKICQFYEESESPFEELIQIFKMNDALHARLELMANNLEDMMKAVEISKRRCAKQGEILLSLLKIKTRKNEHLLEYSEGYKKKDIEDLVKEVSTCSPKQHIFQFYEYWTATQEWITSSIKSTLRPRSKTADSMDVSYTIGLDKFTVERKKPLKEQIWLWKDFREDMDINIELYQNYFLDTQRYAAETAQRFVNKNNIELQNFKCFLPKFKQEATLTLLSQNITIVSSELNISIRWKDIISIEALSQFFDNILVITTSQGKIQLSKFQSALQNIVSSMKEVQEKAMMGSQTKKIESKKQIPLTPEQIQQIVQRKESIIKEVPTLENYKLIVEQTLEGQRIDEVYELVYSDKPFNFYGREQACFFTYNGKKAGNFNWVAEKYDKPGPQFYTLQEGVNFKNCPLFSTRKIRYNHPMKTTGIPFMPKASRNEDERRIYWVSHEQLVYLIKSSVYDVPMADNFVVYLQHRINKVGSAVKVGIYSKIEFVKETAFKNIIIQNTQPQIDTNMIDFMTEIKKLFKLRKEVASGAQIQIEQEPIQEKVTEAPASQVGKLKLYNKILIAGLLALLLLNILGII